MKPRYATAFALLGWYLMMPPPSRTQPFGRNTEAPIAEWEIMQSFDTADACEDSRSFSLDKHKNEVANQPTNSKESYALAVTFAQCVATEDPRLKPK
jgi:hypothetical protein